MTVSACASGPSFKPAPVVPEQAKVGTPPTADTTRTFYDSLSTARTQDAAARRAAVIRTERPALTGDVAWLDVLKDTVLSGLVRTALTQNRDLAVARARIAEYRANLDAVNGALFPRVTLNGSASKNQAVFGGGPPIKFDAFRVTFDVAWEIDFWGRARRGLEAVNADLAQQRALERATSLSLVSDVSSAYLQFLELDQEREITERTLAGRRATLTLARQRFAQGIVSELDVRQFEAQLAVPAARLAQVTRFRSQQEHALNVLLGTGPMDVRRGGALVAAANAVAVPDSLPISLLTRRPDVEAAERAYAGASARIGIADAARLPTFSITGNYGSQTPVGDKLFSSGTEVHLAQGTVSYPLYDGGRAASDAAAARARSDQAKAVWERTVLTALREAGDALVGARTARDEAVATETQASALRRALELAELRYQNGISSYLEVLDAQRGLYDAELTLSQAQLRQMAAAVQLYKALGGSWRP